MSLQNNFPKSRKYYFWAIFLCYLITVDPASSDADRKLFGTLAYRMISKAADSVPSDPVCIFSSLFRLFLAALTSQFSGFTLDSQMMMAIARTEGIAEPA